MSTKSTSTRKFSTSTVVAGLSTPAIIKTVQIYSDNTYLTLLDEIVVNSAGGYIKIMGIGFQTGCTVYFNNALVTSTYINSTEVRVTTPSVSNGSYTLLLVNPSNMAALYSLTASGFPTWTTGSYSSTSSTINVQLQVTGDSPFNFYLQSGSSLPSGVTLSSTGLLSGTISGAVTGTVYTFTVLVDDAQLQTTQQTVTLTLSFSDPYFYYTTLVLNGETSVTPFINDASSNSFGLTINGDTRADKFSPYYGDGYYSNYFNGSTDYLSFNPSTSSQFGTGDFTVEAWIYPTAAVTTQYIVDMRSSTAATGWLFAFGSVTSGKLSWYYNAFSVTETTASVLLNTWNHVAYSRVSGTGRLFVNGNLATAGVSDTNNYANTNTIAYVASRFDQNTTVNPSTFTGYISNLRIVKGTGLYATAFTPSTTPLIAVTNTSLLTCQSNQFVDKSTNNFALTVTGTPKVSPAIPFAASSSYASYGSAYFDGNGDYLTPTFSQILYNWYTADTTIELWVYPTGNNTELDLIGAVNPTSAGADWLLTINNGYPNFYYYSPGNVITSATLITLNAWNHLALVYSKTSNALALYQNGVRVGSYTPSAPTFNQVSTITIGLGGNRVVNPFYLSDIRMVRSVLYSSNFAPTYQPLTAVTNTLLLTCQYNGGANNYGIIDNGPFDNPITRAGNATQGTFSPYSQTGWSNYFPATASYLTGVNSSLNLTSTTAVWTFECWINPVTTASFFAIGSGSPYGNSLVVDWGRLNANKFTVAGGNASSANPVNFTTTNTYPAGVWYHVAVSRTSAGVYTMFINGVQDGTQTYNAATLSAGTTFVINGVYDNNGLGNGGGSFYISNLRFLVGTALYSSNFTPPTSTLSYITNTQLLTCQNNRFIDNSFNNLAITTAGTPSVQATSPFGGTSTTPTSYSVYFDTSSYFTSTSTALAFGTGDFTVEFWSFITGTNFNTTTPGNLIHSGSNGELSIYFVSNGVQIARYNTGADLTSSTILPIAGVWEHWAFSRVSGTGYIFKNGAVAATGAVATNYTSTSLAVSPNSQYISNLRIVKGTGLYSSAFTPSTTPLTAVANTALLTCQLSTIVDKSVNASTFTFTGTPKVLTFNPFGQVTTNVVSYSPTVNGGSTYFDGTGDYLTAASNATLQFTTAFTAECWVYFSGATAATQGIMGYHYVATGTTEGGWVLNTGATGIIVLSTYANGSAADTTALSSGYTVALNTWTHVAVTVSGTTVSIYVNGNFTASKTLGAVTYLSAVFNVGRWNYSSPRYFTGYISDVRVVNGAVLYTSNFYPTSTQLTTPTTTPANLLLNFTNGAIVDAHSGTVNETVGNAQLSTSVKKYGSASMSFNGTSQYLSMPENTGLWYLGTGDFTMEAWVYPTARVTNGAYIVARSQYGVNSDWNFNITSTGTLQFYMLTGGSNIVTSTGTVALNTWTHVAVTRSGTTVKLFINGNNDGTLLSFVSALTASYGPTVIGNSSNNAGTTYFPGYMDDLRITKGFARYTANFTPPTIQFLGQ